MIVEIKDLVKRYKDSVAVDNVSLSIKEGEIFGLLGPNGAGKTTTINCMAGLTRIDSGQVKIFGKSITSFNREIKGNMGIVPQEIAVFYDLTAEENLMYFGKLYGLRGAELKKKVEDALKFTGLWEVKKVFPEKYSGGMKRRLNIACAIVHQPKLIIMDEPTVGIDPQSRNHILNSVRQLNKNGSTIIYTSHYMEEVDEICTDIMIMDNGRIIAHGTSKELKDFISSEEKTVIELSSVNFTIVDNIKHLDCVKDCTIKDRQLTVTSQKNSGNIGKIIDVISSVGADIISINVQKPTLEGVFLTLTGKSLRNGEAEA